MPDEALPSEPPSVGPTASRRRRVPRWLVVGGAALVTVAAVAAVVVVAADERPPAPTGDGGLKLLRAPVQRIPVPQELWRDGAVPSECGVSSATLEQLVPKQDDGKGILMPGLCLWRSAGQGNLRVLTVHIRPAESTGSRNSAGNFGAQVTDLARGREPVTSLKAVAHLGDEAYGWYPPGLGFSVASILVRTKGVVAKVDYQGPGGPGERLPKSQLMASALQTAREVVKGLGAPETEKPTITAIPDDPPPVHASRKACAAVSAETQRRLLGGQPSSGSKTAEPAFLGAPVHDKPKRDTCSWTGGPGKLTVETMTLTDALEGEGAQAARTLEWLQWEAWLRVRHVAHSPSGLTATVLALTGRGDGAFAAYASPIESSALERQHHGQGRVAFRIRNALIQVTYEGNSSRAMPQNQAINGAYTAAAEVAATFTP